ncbi:MAG TPA: low-specificity L-threonine aldolase [Desulfobacterales bacterium]
MSDQPIDLRSDTITRPTESMRRAMAAAEVGDDVFGEDPSINRLEAMAAERLGKEAGLFVSSGTMGNLVCQLTHCGRGDEMILGDQAHIFYYEQGGSAALGGIHPHIVVNLPDGRLDPAAIEAAVRPDNVHFPRSRLIVLENTHNRCNGTPLTPEYLQQVGALARKYDLKLHIDGARLFNAAVALDVSAADLAAEADSVSICLSKGLAAPVGSVVCGSRAFVEQARRNRKILGGGMRQAGVLAAAGIVALTEMTGRLAEDHANARRLAEGLAELDGIGIDPAAMPTNLVFFEIDSARMSAADLVARLERAGVRVLASGPHRLRAVTHYQVTTADIDAALKRFAKVLKNGSASLA